MMEMHAFSQSWDGGSDILRAKNKDKMFLPVGPMNNYKGTSGKEIVRRGNMLVLIPSTTKNPEEVMKFMDWCATKDGKRLLKYGIEGEHYTLQDRKSTEYLKYTQPDADDDLKDPVATEEIRTQSAKDPKYAVNLGINGYTFGEIDEYQDQAASLGIGEADQEKYDYGRKCLALAAKEAKIVDGLPASGLLESFPGIKTLKPAMDAYNDTFIRACFAKSSEEALSIMNAYRKQLKDAGIEQACQYLQDIEDKNPGSVLFYTTN
jgi:putative aldouronate transport system substrate-binding protein